MLHQATTMTIKRHVFKDAIFKRQFSNHYLGADNSPLLKNMPLLLKVQMAF